MNDNIIAALDKTARDNLARLMSLELTACELMIEELNKLATSAAARSVECAPSYLRATYATAAEGMDAQRLAYENRARTLRFEIGNLKAR